MRFVGSWFKASPPLDSSTGERYPMYKWRTLDIYKENTFSSIALGGLSLVGLFYYMKQDQDIFSIIFQGRGASVLYVFALFVSSAMQDLFLKMCFASLNGDVSNISWHVKFLYISLPILNVMAMGSNHNVKTQICMRKLASGERQGAICA